MSKKEMIMMSYEEKNSHQLETLAADAVKLRLLGEVSSERKKLEQMLDLLCCNRSMLLCLSDFNNVGTALMLLDAHESVVKDTEIRVFIAAAAYYCFSKAISQIADSDQIRQGVQELKIRIKRIATFAYFVNSMCRLSYNVARNSKMGTEPSKMKTVFCSAAMYDLRLIGSQILSGRIGRLYSTVKRNEEHVEGDGVCYVNAINDYIEHCMI